MGPVSGGQLRTNLFEEAQMNNNGKTHFCAPLVIALFLALVAVCPVGALRRDVLC